MNGESSCHAVKYGRKRQPAAIDAYYVRTYVRTYGPVRYDAGRRNGRPLLLYLIGSVAGHDEPALHRLRSVNREMSVAGAGCSLEAL
eukprot:COSAG01_NODE_47124_length_393_cov_1.197279_1_plen_87_part_00